MQGLPQTSDYSPSASPTPLEYVTLGQRLMPTDLRWFAYEVYRLAHGNCWAGEVQTIGRMNRVVEWWNG